MPDNIIAPLAPFYCLSCTTIGTLLCEACEETVLDKAPSRCFRCHKATPQFQVCTSCRKTTGLQHVWVVSMYTGVAKELVELVKFERARAGTTEIARCIVNTLSLISQDTLVCHIPTTPKRLRIRGYDQAQLIAKQIARQRSYTYTPLLKRLNASRQVGSSREERFRQANKAFTLNNRYRLNGKAVLIIDDVTTSGATIEAAAKLLKQAGAKTVDAAVFAQAVQ